MIFACHFSNPHTSSEFLRFRVSSRLLTINGICNCPGVERLECNEVTIRVIFIRSLLRPSIWRVEQRVTNKSDVAEFGLNPVEQFLLKHEIP